MMSTRIGVRIDTRGDPPTLIMEEGDEQQH